MKFLCARKCFFKLVFTVRVAKSWMEQVSWRVWSFHPWCISEPERRPWATCSCCPCLGRMAALGDRELLSNFGCSQSPTWLPGVVRAVLMEHWNGDQLEYLLSPLLYNSPVCPNTQVLEKKSLQCFCQWKKHEWQGALCNSSLISC